MSRNRCPGSLGRHAPPRPPRGRHARLQRPFLNQIYTAAEQFADLVFDVHNVEQRKLLAFIECSREIDIRIRRRSPRTVEPNTEMRTTPADLNSVSCARSIAMTLSRSMASSYRHPPYPH
jgi:hypothetical protein